MILKRRDERNRIEKIELRRDLEMKLHGEISGPTANEIQVAVLRC